MQVEKIRLSDKVSLSRIVYGAWRLASDANTSTQHIEAKINACLEQGISSFDHADIYGDYECERLFGKALKANPLLRQKMQLVSKTDIMLLSEKYPQRRVKYYDTSAAHIRSAVDQSLRYLETDYIDTLLIHRPDPLMDAAETGQALDQLIDSGKILSAGVSNFTPMQMQLLQANMQHKLVTNQIELSILKRDSFLNGDLEYLQLNQIPPMAWSPLAGGAIFSHNGPAVRARPILERIAGQFNVGIDAVAIAWLLHHPANIIPVVGTNNLERIWHLNNALKVTIDRQTWFEIWVAAAGEDLP